MHMNRYLIIYAFLASFFIACSGESSSTSASLPTSDSSLSGPMEEISSSSSNEVSEPAKVKSSSSSICNDASECDEVISSSDNGKTNSSSSDNEGGSSSINSSKSSPSDSESSCSMNEESSSSIGDESSSSSSVEQNSFVGELNCSKLLEGEEEWNWNVPKECRFNSAITYGVMTDSRDGQTYKTVNIGEQVWMAENLNYADSANTPSLLNRSWCFNDTAENCAVTGRLYTWAAAIDSVALYDGGNGVDCGSTNMSCWMPKKVQGICPLGWHLPTKLEWNTLFDEVGGDSVAGKFLKSQTGWINTNKVYDYDRDGNGTDAFGFSAFPAGCRNWYRGDLYLNNGSHAYFWSASETSGSDSYIVYMSYSNKSAALLSYEKNYGFPVRCLKD